MSAKSLQLCLTLCDPMDCNPPGSSVHEILQARTLGWIAMPSFRGSSRPRGWTHVSYGSCVAGRFFTAESERKPLVPWPGITLCPLHSKCGVLITGPLGKSCYIFRVLCLVVQSCPTLCNPRDYSSPGSSVHGILLTRILEWVAMADPGIDSISLMSPLAGSLPLAPPSSIKKWELNFQLSLRYQLALTRLPVFPN